MPTPVLIPSYNPDARLHRVLDALPQTVSPVVLINGGDAPENQFGIATAEKFGAELHVYEERGKLPAIQQYLGNIPIKEALSSMLLLDDDTAPLDPQAWHDIFCRILAEYDAPTSVGGPIVYINCPTVDMVLRTARRAIRARLGRANQYGPNMAFKLRRKKVLEKVLELPNIWPGEDAAIAKTIQRSRGKHVQTSNPFALAATPLSACAIPLHKRLLLGPEATRQAVTANYIASGPKNAQPYSKAMHKKRQTVPI